MEKWEFWRLVKITQKTSDEIAVDLHRTQLYSIVESNESEISASIETIKKLWK